MNIDGQDRKILNLLQDDAALTNQEIADRVGGSPTSIWRRIQGLEVE
jgi:Lrp/AsnC family transcriptional regulator